MANVIRIKRKSTTGAPTAGQLEQGELAINLLDEKLYSKNSSDAIFEIGNGGDFLPLAGGTMDAASVTVFPGGVSVPTAPTIGFGGGDTGIYEYPNDNLRYTFAGVEKYQMSATHFSGVTSASFYLANETTSRTNPTLGPRRDLSTGLGSAAASEMSLIAGSVEIMRIVEGANDYAMFEQGTYFAERASAHANITGYGQLWAGTDNSLNFTDEAGANTVLTAAGTIGGSITDNQIAVGATTANSIEGSANLTFDGTTLDTNDRNIDMGEGRLDVKTIYVTGTTGGIVRIYGSGGTAYFSMLHNDTDINLAGLGGTVDMNITGLTAINAGGVDADFDNVTATDFNAVALTAAGSATSFLNAAGTYTTPTGTGISNVVEDGSPQLGADLDLQTFGLNGALQGTGGVSDATIYLTGQGTAISMGTYANIGRLYSNAATMIGNNVYIDSTDTVAGQVRYASSHASYGHTIYEMYAGAHYWYGDSANVTANAIVTKQSTMTLTEAGNLSILGSYTGTNVTSGSNPGHTHTGSSISDLAAGDTTSGVFAAARLSTAPTNHTTQYGFANFSRYSVSEDFNDWKTYPGLYPIFAGANTNAPVGENYDVMLVGRNSSDVGTQLVMPRTASRGLAHRGWSSSGTFISWHYSGWTTTEADANLSLYAKLASPTFTGTVAAPLLNVNTLGNINGNYLVINAGESVSYATGQTGEQLYVNAEGGLQVNSSPDNWATAWAGRDTATICAAGGASTFPGNVTVTGTVAGTTITGTNVTSGENPGHTHTGTSISSLDTGDITTGTMATARLGSGTASSSTYLRGDSTWAAISGILANAQDVTGGIRIDGGGTSTNLDIYTSSVGSLVARFGWDTGGPYWRSLSHGAVIAIEAEDAGGTVRTILTADPDSTTELRADTNLELSVTAGADTALLATANAGVGLYHNNGLEFGTQQHEAAGVTSGAYLYDNQGSIRDVGFNDLKVIAFSSNQTLNDEHCGSALVKTSSSALILYLPSATTQFQDDAVSTVINGGSNAITINASTNSRTLYWLSGTGSLVGGASTNRTLTTGGVATILRSSSTVYYIWGSGIS